MKFTYKEQTEVELLEMAIEEDLRDLVVYNDDFNTFDHVIKTLISVCNHTPEQAEQCTYIIHYKGTCSVKKGSLEDLTPMKDGILNEGIDARIH